MVTTRGNLWGTVFLEHILRRLRIWMLIWRSRGRFSDTGGQRLEIGHIGLFQEYERPREA